MNDKATDIQEFRELFGLWLEAETDREQERRLGELALSLRGEELDGQLRADVLLAASLDILGKTDEPLEALDPDGFAAFVDKTVARSPGPARRRRIRLWGAVSAFSAAAAVLLAVVSVRDGNEAVEPVKATQAAVEQQGGRTLALSVEARQGEPRHEERAQAPRIPAQKAAEVRPATVPSPSPIAGQTLSAARSEEEAETLEVREVTDPEEAALILSESCNLLASCLTKAENSTQEAIVTLNDNINLLNLEYSEI